MSEPRLISPLLDNFIMGDPISDHNGIRCCPAMDTTTNDKYIVKIISFPASQTQLDALLLTKAFENEEAAKGYFETRANELVRESELLQTFSRQEGFLPYKGFQIVPMEEATGYDVYLLAEYMRCLDKHSATHPFTHLDALNLGLDICSAFSACRRSGYLFVNLKPSNIYINQNGEYKIGDLGFVKLSGLKYATMPEHYISAYTAPEIQDPFAFLNETIDVYALGVVLYQIYNGGELPDFTQEQLPAPKYADEEISAIILKACNPNPEERWSDPAQMGQMLVGYMQKNGASDSPIVPIVAEAPALTEPDIPAEPNAAEEEIAEETEEILVDSEESAEDNEAAVAAIVTDEISENIDSADEAEAVTPEMPDIESDLDAAESNEQIQVPVNNGVDEETIASIIAHEAEPDETDSEEQDTQDISYDEVSDEVSMILAQADELASMEVPAPVVAPEPTDIVLPANEDSREPYASPSAEEVADPKEGNEDIVAIKRLIDSDDQTQNDPPQEEYEYFYSAYPPKRRIGKYIIIALIALALIIGGFLFYRFYVLQTIDELTVSGSRDQLTVSVNTTADESLLSIVCTDIYGTPVSVPVVDGSASFSGLLPDTEYTIEVNISGMHILDGDTTASYFTPEKSSIIQYSAVTGNTTGSVILSFTVSGPDSEKWYFTYSAPGTVAEAVSFSGHTVTLTGLDEGKLYTGTLEPESDLFIKDSVEITFSASDVIQASNLIITSCADNKLTAKWNAPENASVDGWTVRCYNDSDYDVTISTTETTVEFSDLDHTDSFTVEVTANGQSVSQRTSIGENTVTVSDFSADTQIAGVITLSWKSQISPESGWIISYTVNDTPFTTTVPGSERQAVIKPAIPGMDYQFMIRSADAETTVFEPILCTTNEAKYFSVNYGGNVITADNLQFTMCLRPTSGGWDHTDVEEYTSVFTPGDLAGFVVHINRVYGVSYDDITAAFVILDEEDQIVSIHSSTRAWSNMWFRNYGELNIPSIPQDPGNYKIQVYFNGQLANSQSFTVE